MKLKDNLLSSLQKIENNEKPIIIIGDIILDEYMVGSPERISREAPVLILEHRENYYRLGGASNAAINAATLTNNVTLIGCTGDDKEAEILSTLCKENNIVLKTIKSKERPTTLKTRILANNQSSALSASGNASRQQVLRIDKLSRQPLSKEEEDKLQAIIPNNKDQLILLSDYQLGVLSPRIIKHTLTQEYKTVVDPSINFSRFEGSDLITPNQPDTEKEINELLKSSNEKDLISFIKSVQSHIPNQKNLLITRGSEGMLLIENDIAHIIPAFNRAEVFDVTGAGDTVSACISTSLAAGNNLLHSIILGNLAASLVVRKSGAATTTIKEMEQTLKNLELPEPKTLNL